MEHEMIEMIREITEAVKGVAPEVWAVLVKQAVIEGYSLLAAVGFTALMTAIGTFTWYASDERNEVAAVVAIVGLFAFVLFTAIFIGEGLPRILNPEYYAIMSLIPGK